MNISGKKKRAGIFIGVCFLLAAGYYLLHTYTQLPVYLYGSTFVKHNFRASGNVIEYRDGSGWEEFIVKGVCFNPPQEQAEDYDFYKEWLAAVAQMNANTVRVYHLMEPAFYEAFADYNTDSKTPLFLLQGIGIEDSLFGSYTDAYDAKLKKHLKAAALDAVDAVHGNLPSEGYRSEVSDYTLGFIIGDRWDPEFIIYTNEVGETREAYQGRYITAPAISSAFEQILAETVNLVFSYDTGKYNTQHMVAFGNEHNTDNVVHLKEKINDVTENKARLDENILGMRNTVKTGIFAAYQVDMGVSMEFNYEPHYTDYLTADEKKSPFTRYLLDLKEMHETMPLIITGFGLSTSRGISGLDEVKGYNRGGLTEEEQAEGLTDLYVNLLAADCSGGCISDLFDSNKETAWNTSAYVEAEGAKDWINVQDSEHGLGLVGMMSSREAAVNIDGELTEWSENEKFLEEDGTSFYCAYDEKYVYIAGEIKDFDFQGDNVFLDFDITPGSGSLREESFGLEFDREADFLLAVYGMRGAQLYVQEYYDTVKAIEKELADTDKDMWLIPEKNSAVFSIVRQYAQRKTYLQRDGDLSVEELAQLLQEIGSMYESTEPAVEKTGMLQGDKGDYGYGENCFEVRIPWMLLNFTNPSEMKILGDLYAYRENAFPIDEMYVGVHIKRNGGLQSFESSKIVLKGWGNETAFSCRKKAAYSALRELWKQER